MDTEKKDIFENKKDNKLRGINTMFIRYKECNDYDLKEQYFDSIIEMILSSKHQINIDYEILDKFAKRICNGKYYDILLKYYKEYDYLNNKENLVKILVSYIKPSFLLKSKILTPIHLGRKIEKENSKDGIISDNDIKWLHNNCMGDDDFEGNISNINRRVGLFTGTYFAWKNYEKLGNPKYFGNFGYRKLLFPNCLNNLEKYDLILPQHKIINETLKVQMINCHGQKFYDILIETFKELHPKELENIEAYLNSNIGYYGELYIMKKDIFFSFCKYMYNLLIFITQKYPDTIQSVIKFSKDSIENLTVKFLNNNSDSVINNDKRDIGFLFEILTGYYLYKLKSDKNIKYKEVNVFEPDFVILTLHKKQIIDKMRENAVKSFRGNKNV